MVVNEKQLTLLTKTALDLKKLLEQIVANKISAKGILDSLNSVERDTAIVHTELVYGIVIEEQDDVN